MCYLGNALLQEIKEIYCGNLQLRKYTTQLLAENNGLLAALANNLPLCSRLKPNGVHLIVQQCKEMNVTIRGQKRSVATRLSSTFILSAGTATLQDGE